MMKELRNVLTVRTANKTSLKVKRPRKTKSKHVKRKDKVLSQSNQTSDQLSKDKPDGTITEQCTAVLPDTSTDMQHDKTIDNVKDDIPLTTPCDTKADVLHDTEDNNNIQDQVQDILHGQDDLASNAEDVSHDTEDDNVQDTLHGLSNNRESCKLLMEDTNPVMMRHIATMAAKMALKHSRGTNKQEEVFGSEQ